MHRLNFICVFVLLLAVSSFSYTEKDIHQAVQEGNLSLLKELIEKGADINSPNKSGNTPLISAVMNGSLDLMEFLLEKGAEPNLENIYSQTPMAIAVSTGRLDLMELLYANGAVIKKNDLNLLHYAIMNRQRKAADFLIRHALKVPVSGEEGRIFLHQAAQNGMSKIVRLMMEKGADIRSISPEGGTLLHSAAFGGDPQLIDSLFRFGLEVDALDSYGMTPLHFAAIHGLENIASKLVKKGAEIDAANIMGETPLDMALSHKKEKTAESLRSLGASQGHKKMVRELDQNLAPSFVWRTGASIPSYIRNLGAAAVDGKVYAVGGYDRDTLVANANYEYDPKKDTWTIRADMPTSRSNLAVISLNKKVYAFGGNTGEISNEVYDPKSDKWQALAPLLTPRFHINGSAAAASKKIHVMGGEEKWFVTSAKNEVYDPSSDSWDEKAPLPTPRQSPVLVECSQKIYAIGGHGGYLPLFANIPIVEAYDPVLDRWERKADLPESGFAVGAVAAGGKIFVLIQTGFGEKEESKIYVYAPKADKWSVPVDVPRAVRFAGMAYVDNALYIIGGGNSKELFSTILIGEIQKRSRFQ